MNSILLSFDLEEFDIPEEYGQSISEDEKLMVTGQGLECVLAILQKHSVKATFYTTAFFAERNPKIISDISEKHEIASHGYYHSSFKPEDILNSKNLLEKITEKPVIGFRMPRLQSFNESLLVNAGYLYNSSLNPTFIPGRYNNLGKPKKPFFENGLLQLPSSVSPFLRIPLFWISFKTFPESFYTMLSTHTLKKENYLNVYFHPWEFTDIRKYKIPFYTKRFCGKQLADRFERFLIRLNEYGIFMTSQEYYKEYTKKNNQ